ncbi:MAG: hypothetical protein Q8P27_01190 [Candidatus Peregrinibacteria bacterium]|nr:hypothetical protein [Candidatus Peregrinibacteria bacterium]
MKLKSTQASVALISLLIISAFTLILVVAMSETNISTSYQYLNNSSNKVGYYVAEGCLEETLLRLEQDTTFTGTTIAVDTDTSCVVTVTGTTTRTIDVAVTYLDYTQNFEATASITQAGEANNATLLTWKEV